MLRHAPVFAAFADAVASGRYGRPMAVVFRDDQYFPIQGMYGSTWRADVTKAGGGTLIEHSVHDLDVLRWILGARSGSAPRTARTFGHAGIEDVATLRCGFGPRRHRHPHERLAPGDDPALDPPARGLLRGGDALDRGRLPRPAPRRDLGGHEEVVGRAARLDRPAPHPEVLAKSRGAVRRPEQAVPRCPGQRVRRWGGRATGMSGGPTVDEALAAHEVVDAAYRSAAAGGTVTAVPGAPAGHGRRTRARVERPCAVREDCPMPLSEEELRILQEIEANLTATDPALVQQVSETTLYRHAARSIKWAVFGFVAGLVLLVATFTKVLVLGFVGFLVMLGVPARDRAQRPQARQGRDGQPHVIVPRGFGRRLLRLRGRRMRERWRRDDTS